MRYRSPSSAILLLGLLVPFNGCINAPSLTSITISPTSMNFGGAGLTAQLTATGYYTHPGHQAETKNITNLVSWSSSASECVTVNNTGLITSGNDSCSNILITASAPGFNGYISANMTVNVTQPTTGGTGPTGAGDVNTINIIPSSQSVPTVGDTAQFLAIGVTTSGATVNLDGLVSWTSSSPQVATIGATSGLATAVAQGSSTISALYTNADGTTATGTATFTVVGGTSEAFTAISIIPASQSVSASGQSATFIALATSGSTNLSEDVTNATDVVWSSTIPTIATVTSGLATGNGVVTGVSVGTSTIVAQLTNPTNGSVLTAQATVSVTATAAPEPLLSLTIIPTSITVGNLQDTGNFLAVGTFSQSPYVRDLTNSVTWLSSAPEVFPVITSNDSTPNPGAPAGTVTAYGNGSATIIAEATDPTTGSIQTAIATFSCPLVLPNPPTVAGSCYSGSQAPSLLATVTVYNEGLNTTDWLITAPSATGTANVIHCGPGSSNAGLGGSVCVATYPVGTTVVLTAPSTGAQFGGWSSSCTTINPNPSSAAGPNTCQFTISDTNTNISVGAIFN
jgi:uncharacterized protein YjdB